MQAGRNDPCPCGSGKKYKKCCLLNGHGTDNGESRPAGQDEPEEIFDEKVLWSQTLTRLRRLTLDKKPHIKEYYKVRKMHNEMIDAMVQYYYDGKFERKSDDGYNSHSTGKNPKDNVVQLFQCEFDLENRESAQAFFDMLIYKPAPNTNCITEEFIQKQRYRKEDKVALLHSMLSSTPGLFEIVGADANEGYVFIQEVFTGAQHTLIDVALSGSGNYSDLYLYVRIIEHQGICFNSGLNLTFFKTDPFIQEHIRRHRKSYDQNGEFIRFTQLYNQFFTNPGGVTIVTNPI